MACNHKFQGHKDGVTCLLCGLRMTAAEYAFFLEKTTAENRRDKERLDEAFSNTQKPTESINPPVKSAPKRARKKKEVTAGE